MCMFVMVSCGSLWNSGLHGMMLLRVYFACQLWGNLNCFACRLSWVEAVRDVGAKSQGAAISSNLEVRA